MQQITLVFLTSLIFSIIGVKCFILQFAKKSGGVAQPIYNLAPERHQTKAGTPTMGGVPMILAAVFSMLIWGSMSEYAVLLMNVALAFMALGFVDDYKKVTKKRNNAGFYAKTKLVYQFVISLAACMYLNHMYAGLGMANKVFVPAFGVGLVDIGIFYILFTVFVLVGSTNAVNLTDGLDGLVGGTSIIAFGAFAAILLLLPESMSKFIHIGPSAAISHDVLLCVVSMMGAILGFLCFNFHPAKIFMGDSGSLSIGGVLGMVAIMLQQEILLAIIGVVFVVEALSVMLQVGYFRYTRLRHGEGRRIFLMAPLHHHFEKKGMSEGRIVLCFWMVSLMAGVCGALLLLL